MSKKVLHNLDIYSSDLSYQEIQGITRSTMLSTYGYFIDSQGKAFISQRELSRLCGVDQSSIARFFASRNIDVNHGVSSENARLCITFYAVKSKTANNTARESLAIIAEAGMTAFIYNQAGYELKAEPRKPPTALELARENVALLEQLELLEEENRRVEEENRRIEEEKRKVESELNVAIEKIIEDTPKVIVYDTLLESDTTELVGNVAKLIKIPPRTFFSQLRSLGYLNRDNTPSQKSINSGYMSAKIHYYTDNKGRQHENITSLVTMKGVTFFSRKFNNLVELYDEQIEED